MALLKFALKPSALGRMSFRRLEGDPAEKVIAYSYDAAGRLIGSQHGDHAHRYSVDAAGNRLESQNNQQALPDNRLTQLNGARYRYDGLGRRISKTVRHTNGTTATTHYGWDGDRIVREETENQRTTVVYEPGSFVPMLRIDDTQQGQILSAYITDALGTPMQLVTPTANPAGSPNPTTGQPSKISAPCATSPHLSGYRGNGTMKNQGFTTTATVITTRNRGDIIVRIRLG